MIFMKDAHVVEVLFICRLDIMRLIYTLEIWHSINILMYIRLRTNLVRGSVFFGRLEVWFWRTNLVSWGWRFSIFRFVPIPNGKFYNFLIFYEVRTFGLVWGSVFFGRFKVQFQWMNLGLEGSRFGFLEVQEVQGSVFSGSFLAKSISIHSPSLTKTILWVWTSSQN